MAMIEQFLTPAEDGVSQSLAATTASSAITVPSRLFTIGGSAAFTVTWGRGGVAAATPSATVGTLIPAGTLVHIDAGEGPNRVDTLKIFNVTAATANYGVGPWRS